MKRREFTQSVVGLGVLGLPMWLSVAHAQAGKPQPGKDYEVLKSRAAVDAPAGKIEVVEFFWYSCAHCNAFEPLLEQWVKKLPKDVVFRRVPVAFRADFVPQQRLFYTLEKMGLVDKLHAKVFAAIHVDRLALNTGELIAQWVGRQGVDVAKFVENYNSFAVMTKANKASQLQNAYRVEGVPALGVAGHFYTDGAKAGGLQQALQVTEFLVTQARAAL